MKAQNGKAKAGVMLPLSLKAGFSVMGRSRLQNELKENPVFLLHSRGSGSATALHPLLTLKIEGSCTARPVAGQPHLVYSEKLKVQHAPDYYRKRVFHGRN
jgi:hypothetical protein